MSTHNMFLCRNDHNACILWISSLSLSYNYQVNNLWGKLIMLVSKFGKLQKIAKINPL